MVFLDVTRSVQKCITKIATFSLNMPFKFTMAKHYHH